jgi:S1-C subfamily serine protease
MRDSRSWLRTYDYSTRAVFPTTQGACPGGDTRPHRAVGDPRPMYQGTARAAGCRPRVGSESGTPNALGPTLLLCRAIGRTTLSSTRARSDRSAPDACVAMRGRLSRSARLEQAKSPTHRAERPEKEFTMHFRQRLAFLICAALLGAGLAREGLAQQAARAVYLKALPALGAIDALDARGTPMASGSGFFIDDEGTFVTNYHVIEGAASLSVRHSSGSVHAVEGVRGYDEAQDLALLAVTIEGVSPIPVAVTSANIGDEVIVLGSPLGLDSTVSAGIISGFRSLGENVYLYQLTAAVSPGSSGGPVLNTDGALVGVTRATVEQGQSLNFAIPAQTLELLLVRSSGHAPASVRGVTGYEAPHDDAVLTQDALGLTPAQRLEYTRRALRVNGLPLVSVPTIARALRLSARTRLI